MADLFNANDLKITKELKAELEKLRKLFSDMVKNIKSVQTAFNDQAKSQADTGKQAKKLTVLEQQLLKVQKQSQIAEAKLTAEYKKANLALIRKKEAVRKSTEELKKQAGVVKKSGGLFKTMVKSLSVVAAGFLSVQAAITVLKKAFTTIKDFGKDTAVLAGILNKTTVEIKGLTNEAKRLGAAYPVTAKQVLELETAYARLGFQTKDIINLSEATVRGSIALNAGLQETAELTGAVVNTFKEFSTADAPEIMDILAKSTNLSALNFEKLNKALPIVGGAANAAGINFTQLVSLLGKLSDAGIDASSSSTALRNIFIESAKQGLSYNEILDKISGSSDKLTSATDEFGKRSAVSGLVIAENIKGVRDLDSELQKAGGTAQRMADLQIDTLDGAIKGLQSAYEGLILSFDGSGGVLKNLINYLTAILRNHEIITDVIRDVFKSYKDLIGAYGEVLVALGLVNKEEEKGIGLLKILAFTVKATTYPIMLLVKGITAVVKQFAKLIKQVKAVRSSIKGVAEESEESTNALDKIAKKAEILAKKVKENQDKLDKENDLAREKKIKADKEKADAEIAAIKKASEVSKKESSERTQREKDASFVFVDLKAKEFEAVKGGLDKQAEAEKLHTLMMQAEEDKRLAAFAERIAQQAELDAQSKEIASEAEQAGQQLANDLAGYYIDEKLAKFNDAAEAEKEILKNKLDKGLITEAQYNKKIESINKKSRIEEAKADKKKSLFEIGIQTLVNIVKVASRPFLIPGMIAIGLIQAAAVASRPIPKYKTGLKQGFKDDRVVQVGDGYKRELVKTPFGSFLSNDKPQNILLPANSTILSGEDTEKELGKNNMDLSELIKEERLTRQAILSQPKKNSEFTPTAIYYTIEYQNRINKIRGRYIN